MNKMGNLVWPVRDEESRMILRHLRKRTAEPQPPVDDRERYAVTNTPDYSSDKIRGKRVR